MLVFPIHADVERVRGPAQGEWTYEDWENLPDDGHRYEVIDGVLYVFTSPSLFHQWIIQNFYTYLGVPAINQKSGYAFLAPVGVLMPDCKPVQPDFVFVKAERASIIYDRRIRGVPDLIAEGLSPGSVAFDEEVKLAAYAKAGVPEYVIIDPDARVLRLYSLQKAGDYGDARIFNVGESVTFACLPTISVTVGILFEGAPDTTL